MRTYRIIAALGLCCLTAGIFLFTNYLRQRAASIFFQNLGPGWNLGNTLDCHELKSKTTDPLAYEVYWGNPVTTRELFEKVRESGFKTVRIPVTWYPHMNEKYEVDSQWMERVKQVVDDALSSDLYVILNTHHERWLIPSRENSPLVEAQFTALWKQIADAFAGYDERLLFEAMNEPRLIGTDMEWTDGTTEARGVINRLNKIFVETIRSKGEQNRKRYLLVPTYCAKIYEGALKDFVKPNDTRVGVSIHIYSPYSFAQNAKGKKEWDPNESNHTKSLDAIFQDINTYLIDKGIPIVITEFGAINKNNEESRAKWTAYIVDFAVKNKISYVWWDNGGKAGRDDTYNLLDRYDLEWKCMQILNELVRAGDIG